MMVVLAIIAIISVITLVGQSAFNQTLILKDTSYAIEYSLRQAQTFGLSNTKSGSFTDISYGLNFNASTPSSYTFFADTDQSLSVPSWCPLGTAGTPDQKYGDCQYSNGNDTLIRTTTFTRGFKISDFCAKTNGTRLCASYTGSSFIKSLDIVFARPSPKPIMTATFLNGNIATQVTCAEIYVKAPTGGVTNTIRISEFGEMSLNQTCP